ncbi:hypothetical protein K474DRAFT_1676506 [Panus rudis PR-1116 ss-1]|nr:hypothetical protein K474DRAFT_1676506 [Panus rudis PR-1116 ss-1]
MMQQRRLTSNCGVSFTYLPLQYGRIGSANPLPHPFDLSDAETPPAPRMIRYETQDRHHFAFHWQYRVAFIQQHTREFSSLSRGRTRQHPYTDFMSERFNFEQYGTLRALHYSASERPTVRSVCVQHHAIDNGITIPFLRAYTQVRGRIRTAEVLVFEGDIFVFRSSRRRGYLIDIKHGDEILMRIAVDRFIADFGRQDYPPPTRVASSNRLVEVDYRRDI